MIRLGNNFLLKRAEYANLLHYKAEYEHYKRLYTECRLEAPIGLSDQEYATLFPLVVPSSALPIILPPIVPAAPDDVR